MERIDSFYDFLEDVKINQDGSFDYSLTKRLIGKWKDNPLQNTKGQPPLRPSKTKKKDTI